MARSAFYRDGVGGMKIKLEDEVCDISGNKIKDGVRLLINLRLVK